MAEYIIKLDDHDSNLMNRWMEEADGPYSVEIEGDIINRLVRCRDCGDDKTPDGVKLHSRRYCIMLDQIVKPDGFCAWGEPKEVE